MPICTDPSRLVRFWTKVAKTSGCWNWLGGLAGRGYGTFWDGARPVYAHRFSYEVHKGPIPEGLTVDHLCRNPRCVNPDHLEAVTLRENLLRGDTIPARNARTTHCPKGHEYTKDNTYVVRERRICRTCVLSPANREARKLSTRKYRAARRCRDQVAR